MEGRAGICLHGGRATGNVRFQLSVPPRRSQDMNGTTSAGFTVWFTGMSGAGKSTLAAGLANRLRRLGKTVEVLDGGEAEQFLNVAHGQNEDARNHEAVEHILGQLVAQRLIDPTVAAMKSRPKISARGKPRPTPAPAAPRKAPKPEKIRPVKLRKTVKLHKKAAPKHRAAARTARVEPRRAAAGGKRKR